MAAMSGGVVKSSVLVPDLDCGGLLGLLIDALQQVHQLCLAKLGHCKGT